MGGAQYQVSHEACGLKHTRARTRTQTEHYMRRGVCSSRRDQCTKPTNSTNRAGAAHGASRLWYSPCSSAPLHTRSERGVSLLRATATWPNVDSSLPRPAAQKTDATREIVNHEQRKRTAAVCVHRLRTGIRCAEQPQETVRAPEQAQALGGWEESGEEEGKGTRRRTRHRAR